MKNLLKTEELALFGFSIYLFAQTDFAWWWYPALFLAPDLGMLGYLAGPQVGAFVYNLFHHKAIAVVMLCLGWFLGIGWLALAGIILLGHASFDRILGYGLKYPDSFQHTHLGRIGKPQPDVEFQK